MADELRQRNIPQSADPPRSADTVRPAASGPATAKLLGGMAAGMASSGGATSKGIMVLEKLSLLVEHFDDSYINQAMSLAERFRIKEVLPFLAGLALLFCGGYFMLTIAAVQAFRQFGWSKVQGAIGALGKALKDARCALRDCRARQPAGASAPHVERLLSVLRVVPPEVVSDAVGGVLTGVMAVVAALQVEFARSLLCGNELGDAAYRFADAQGLSAHVSARCASRDAARWAEAALKWAFRVVGLSIALALRRVLYSFQSSLQGANILVHAVLSVAQPVSGTAADVLAQLRSRGEVAVWVVAALGFWYQLYNGFDLQPFVKLILAPAVVVEWVLSLLL